jgi:hypothetical protein
MVLDGQIRRRVIAGQHRAPIWRFVRGAAATSGAARLVGHPRFDHDPLRFVLGEAAGMFWSDTPGIIRNRADYQSDQQCSNRNPSQIQQFL